MRRVPAIAAMLAAVATLSWPCIWDSDTIEMETARFPEVIELLSGNFLYHSSEFYRWRVADRLAILAEDPDNLPARDELAAALDKLGRAAEAVEVMSHSYELDPDRYETLANLGTFLIHSGDLQKGVEYIELAIAINPDAHFGREIYQRHLVRYLIERAEQGKSILAAAGGEEWSFYHYLENEKRSRTGDRRARRTLEETQAAIRGVAGMMRFGDYAAPVLLGALGDLLMLGRPYATQNAGQLAALAYLRAEAEVGTPEASAAYRRLAEYAMSIHDRSDLEQIEELMHELVAEGAELRAQIAADEERWIEAGLDPEEQFARKYYDDVRSEGAWGVAWSTMTAVSLAQKLATFTDHWQPRTVAQFNGHDLMVVKVKGEFVWHKHDDTDDLFLVLSGRVTIRLRDGEVTLGEGELLVVPRGVEHCPVAEEEAHLLLIEATGTPNTGDSGAPAAERRVI